MIDDIDIKIIKELNKDARLSYRDLAKKLNLAVGTVSSHLKKLEDQGIIQGYVPVVNPSETGFDLSVVVGVRVGKGKLKEVEEKIAKSPNVVAVYDVTGEWDIFIIAHFRTRIELDSFVKSLQTITNVERTNTFVVLNTVKEDFRLNF